MAQTRSGRRTDYNWVLSTFSFALAADALGVATVLSSSLAATWMRVRGNISVSLDATADGDQALVGLGIIKSTAEAIAAGVASMPGPITDGGQDWLWHQIVPLQVQTLVGDNSNQGAQYVEVDSKAMRKMRSGTDDFALVVHNMDIVGAPSVDIVGGVRVLFGL